MLNEIFDYKPFLKEAFIDPIRTVTVIDDEYPTLEHLISKGKDDFEDEDISRLEEIIKVSRGSECNWLLDVYDGEESSLEINDVSKRLHHSDLLILDYHLDGEDEGVCEKSLNIIKGLANNRQFNIVVVHTKGYTGDAGTVNDVLRDVIASLQSIPQDADLHENAKKKIEESLDEWSYENQGIKAELLESISNIDMFSLINKYENEFLSGEFEHEKLNEFNSIYCNKPDDLKLSKKLLVRWLVSEKFSVLDVESPANTSKYLDWGVVGDINWVRTEDLFLTVLGKKTTPINEITNKLLDAMESWRPHPHKLILSKLRNDVESKGISASSNILNKKHLQAAWLKELLRADNPEESKASAWSTVSKLWEELASEIKGDLGEFTIRLKEGLKSSGHDEIGLLNHFKAGAEDELEQIKHANCFSCSRSVSSHHLLTGHIIKVENDFLICLTPACDLVPGQKNKSDDSGSLMPVTFVHLFDAFDALHATRESMRKALGLEEGQLKTLTCDEQLQAVMGNVNQNNLIFIQPDIDDQENIKILSFTYGLDGKSNPNTKHYYVKNQGVFDENKNIEILISKPKKNEDVLDVKPKTGKVVAELRYEYALNLLGKLGYSNSRVGLAFINE